MKFLRRFLNFSVHDVKCVSKTRCLLTEKQSKIISEKKGIKDKIISEIEKINGRLSRADSKLDDIEATVDGDPEWFLTLERRRGKRE